MALNPQPCHHPLTLEERLAHAARTLEHWAKAERELSQLTSGNTRGAGAE